MKDLIIMDIASIVKELGADVTIKVAKEHGFLFWDSGWNTSRNPVEPKVVQSSNGKFENIQIIDIQKELTQEQKDLINEKISNDMG